MELLIIFFSAAVINNVILSQFLGICSFLGVSKKTSGALGMGMAVTLVILVSSIIT
jgi:electron transport complex protein RnfA